MTRKAAVSGMFYPSNRSEIEGMYSYFNKLLDELDQKELLQSTPKAIIAPHAGYIYSGFTANVAYKALKNSNAQRALVIGPSHRVPLKGSSIGMHQAIETPFGVIDVDIDFANELKSIFNLEFYPNAHCEHSTETQFPFIKYYMPNTKVIELIYGDEEPQRLSEIIKHTLNEPKSVVIISTDLSHFYSLKEAKILDSMCLEAIVKGDFNKLKNGCEACGIIGVAAMMLASNELNIRPILLDYRTSADASGDSSRVVGYMSAMYV